jgi:hypothetical protein
MKRVIAKIEFIGSDDGGRAQPIPILNFGCPVFFEDIEPLSEHGYDCRILVPEYGRPIAPGDVVNELAMIFLSEEAVLPHLRMGSRFTLWEGKTIARGEVLRIEG